MFGPLTETASHEALRLLAIALMENGDGAAFGEETWLGLDNLIGRLQALDAAGVRTILP